LPVKYQSWWWRDLTRICREGGGDGWFQDEVGWKIGSGDKIRFWEDVWVGNSKLKTLFPRLFSLSLNQGHKVEEVGGWEGSEWRWTLSWRRGRFEWETLMEAELDVLISRVKVMKDEKDPLLWSSEAPGCFTVSSTYKCLVKTVRGPQIEVFKYLWKAKTFPNVMFTAWRMLLNRIPTRSCLRRRGVLLDMWYVLSMRPRRSPANISSWSVRLLVVYGPYALDGLEFFSSNIMILGTTLKALF